MRRHRRGWLRPSEPSSPLGHATNIGVALPSFNFIEPKAPRRPPPATAASTASTILPSIKRNNSPPNETNGKPAYSSLDCDAIVYHTLLRYADELHEPAMTEESKMTRLWQSLQRHSEAGRFRTLTEYSPNPICSFLALEILQQILEASGVSLMLTNLLVGAIGNSIFMGYEPDRPRHEMKQYADIAHDLHDQLTTTTDELAACKKQAAAHKSQLAVFQLEEGDSSAEDKARLVTAVFRSVEEQGRGPTLLVQTLTPFFNDELLLLLWNAMAKDTATQSLVTSEGESVVANDSESAVGSFTSHRKRASIMATRVLKERVRLMLILWQTLSSEERDVVSKCLAGSSDSRDTNNNGVGLKGVLQMLEEVYMSEQVRDRSSPRRSMFLSPVARHSSVVFRPPPLAGQGGGGMSPGMGFARAKSRQRLMSMRFPLVSSTSTIPEQGSTVPTPANISIPDVLLGALAEGHHEAATEESQFLIEQLAHEQEEILQQCEDIFDLLCEDPAENGVPKRSLKGGACSDAGAQAIVDLAKERMCELLCGYVDAPSFIMEKFEKSEADRAVRESVSRDLEDVNGTSAVVQMLIQRQRQNPMVLVNAINQSPEILLTAITQNNGILRFAITKFVPLVKRFLRLDLKACEFLDMLAQKNKGIQLLWGTTTATTAGSSQVSASNASETNRFGSVSAVFEEVMSRRRSSVVDLSTSRAAALLPGELHLLEWFAAHTEDLALLSLKRPDVLPPLFVEMHTLADVGTFHKVMVQLASTKGVQNFIQRSSVITLEKIAQEDPAAIARLLREILTDAGNLDLIHQLRAAPYLTSCLSEFHPTAIQDVIASDMDMWKPFFVETVAANDAMIKEVLVTRTEELAGAETLVNLFAAVVAGSTAGLNLQALDFGATPADVAFSRKRDGLSSRKMVQCVYLRGGSSVCRAVITQLIATAGFHPHEHSLTVSASSFASPWVSRSIHPRSSHTASTISGNTGGGGRAKGKKAAAAHSGAPGSPSKKRPPPPHSINKKDDVVSVAIEASAATLVASSSGGARGSSVASATSEVVIASSPPQQTAGARLLESMPVMWRSFALVFWRQQPQQHGDGGSTTTASEPRAPTLARAHAKTLILDLWIEFLKVDAVQLDNACLWSLAPFVCDYLVTRYDSPVVVGAWICALAEAVTTHQDDPRIAFFASSCGFRVSATADMLGDGYDTFLYYAHALGYILFGRMKIFKPECRLEETADGSCPVEKQIVIATAVRLFDHRLLSGPEIDELMARVEALPVVDHQLATVELDDAMGVFLDQWRLVNRHVDERYRQAFACQDPAGSNRIGLEQFIKVVTSVTLQAISPRECLLVFCDVGQELLDLDTLLRVTRVYHLRRFNTHLPEIALDESDLQELTQSVGRANIFSLAREVEDLERFWKGLRVEVHEQIDALHQSKHTKMHLKKQSALIEKLLHDVQTNPQPPSGASPSATTGIRPRSQQQPHRTATAGTGPQVLYKAWTELRACAKLLQSAKLTQHYLSRLYIQTCIVRWIRQTRKRRLARAASGGETLSNDAANGPPSPHDAPRL